MPDEEAVLAANEAFYRAFDAHDLAAMDAVWARETPVACIHPGWDTLVGREPVMRSWAAILGNPDAPRISCRAAKAFMSGQGAFVVCQEVLGGGVLTATNCFVREADGWRMVHHHASPLQGPAPPVRSAGTIH